MVAPMNEGWRSEPPDTCGVYRHRWGPEYPGREAVVYRQDGALHAQIKIEPVSWRNAITVMNLAAFHGQWLKVPE